MSKSKQWQALNRKIRAIERAKGIDRATHECVVMQTVRKTSLSDCTEQEMQTIVDHLQGPASTGTARPGFKPSSKAYVRKIWAIWGSLKQAGKLDAEDTDAALLAFANGRLKNRQLDNVRQLDWLTFAEAAPIIDALKSWDARK